MTETPAIFGAPHGLGRVGQRGRIADVPVVRVKNEIAGFAIGGVASEACGASAKELLAEVAGEL